MSAPLRLHLGSVAVEVRAPQAVRAALLATLGACQRAQVPAAAEVRLELDEAGRLREDGRPVGEAELPLDALPLLEGRIYAAYYRLSRETLLHAAGLVVGGRALLLLGDSGAGKSTLTRAGLARGHRALSDEVVGLDAERLVGLPRALQFDATPADEAGGRAFLAGCDLTRYPLRDEAGRALVLPFVELAPEQRWQEPLPRARLARLVFLRHEPGSPTRLTPCPPLEALAALSESALTPPGQDWRPLELAVRARRLSWSDPAQAWALLEEDLAAAP